MITVKENIFSEQAIGIRTNWLIALPFLTLLFFIVGQLIAVIPVFETGLLDPETIETYPSILYMLFGPFTMILVLLVCWVKFFEKRTISGLGIQFSHPMKSEVLQGLFVGLTMATIIVGSIYFIGGYEIEENQAITFLNIIPPLLLFLGFSLQATVEEIIFRGWLFSRITEQKGVVIGVLGSSILFTLIHLLAFDFENSTTLNLMIFSGMTFVFSVFLAIVTLHQKSIWFASAWHAVWNWLFISGFGLPTTGIALDIRPLVADFDTVISTPVWLSGGTDGPENSIVTLIVLILASVISWKLISRRSNEENNS